MKFTDKLVYENETKSEDPMGVLGSSHINNRHSITYPNPLQNFKEQTQSYLDMNDIAVPIIIKKGEDGQIYFAMQYIYIPAKKQNFLELPSIGIQEKKENYSEKDTSKAIVNLTNLLQLQLSNGSINKLSPNYDPVSQSFTNQTVEFVELGVKNKQGDKRLHWFPISSLQDILSRDLPMSIQTKYALLLFAQKHKKELDNIETTKADIDKKLLTKKYSHIEDSKKTDEIIYPHEYRFGVAKGKIPGEIQDLRGLGKIDYATENIEENYNGISAETSVYGMSKDSIQCVITRKVNGKVQVALLSQLRSPFIPKNTYAKFSETPAGMIDEKDYQNIDIKSDEYKNLDQATKETLDYYAGKKAAAREVLEETGISISDDELIVLSQDLLLSYGTEEMSKFYLAELPSNYIQGSQKLDDQEVIGKLTWYDLDSLDINRIHAPLPTKIALTMAKNYIVKQKEKQIHHSIDNLR